MLEQTDVGWHWIVMVGRMAILATDVVKIHKLLLDLKVLDKLGQLVSFLGQVQILVILLRTGSKIRC